MIFLIAVFGWRARQREQGSAGRRRFEQGGHAWRGRSGDRRSRWVL